MYTKEELREALANYRKGYDRAMQEDDEYHVFANADGEDMMYEVSKKLLAEQCLLLMQRLEKYEQNEHIR